MHQASLVDGSDKVADSVGGGGGGGTFKVKCKNIISFANCHRLMCRRVKRDSLSHYIQNGGDMVAFNGSLLVAEYLVTDEWVRQRTPSTSHIPCQVAAFDSHFFPALFLSFLFSYSTGFFCVCAPTLLSAHRTFSVDTSHIP